MDLIQVKHKQILNNIFKSKYNREEAELESNYKF